MADPWIEHALQAVYNTPPNIDLNPALSMGIMFNGIPIQGNKFLIRELLPTSSLIHHQENKKPRCS